MERTEVLDMMTGLKLYGMRSAYDETLATAIKRKHEPQRLVGDLLKAEISEKQARSIKYQLTGRFLILWRSSVWTSENRVRYDRSKLRYPSDLTDAEWAHVAPLIPPARRGGNRRHVDEREVVNGLMYILSTGCQWRAVPKDLPPRSTLYDYFDLWSYDGTLDRLHEALYVKCREQAGRDASPTAAILDSQSVKSAEKGAVASTRMALMQARRSKARSGISSSIRKAS